MTDRHASILPPFSIVAGSWKWLVAGLVLAAGIFTIGHASHKGFRETLVESFNAHQGMFARSLENAVKDHLFEEEQDLRLVVKEIRRNEGGVSSAADLLPALYVTHLDDFYSLSLADKEGKIIFTTPETAESDREPHAAVRRAILDNRGLAAPFLSERFLDARGRTMLFMLVPFTMPGGDGKIYYVVGGLRIEDYMVSHFPSWRGKSMGFVLVDDSGDILSMLNTRHETDDNMKRGNLLQPAPECLECHEERSFDYIREAAGKRDVVHSVFRSPSGGSAINQSTVSILLYNENWLISIFSPFESIQDAIRTNFLLNMALTSLSLLMVGSLSFVIYKAFTLEERARSSEALERYAGRLEEANRVKDLFTDVVSHELLSPVAVVGGYTDILRSGEEDPKRRAIFASLRKSLERLTEIIEGSSKLSKLQDKEVPEVRDLDLGEMLRESAASFGKHFEERRMPVLLEAEGSYPVSADPLISEVFTNLLSNAAKYNFGSQPVEAGIIDGGESWLVYVKDRGEGIPDCDKHRIFDRYERLGKDGIKGSGLGLAIVKRIVSLHDGRVWVEDNPGGGSAFFVELPKDGPGGGGRRPLGGGLRS